MSNILVGNAPCSWGTLEFGGLKGDRIPYSRMLDELVEGGYTGTELGDWGFFPTDPELLYTEFAARGLAVTGAYIGVPFRAADRHAAAEATALKIARQIGGLAERLGGAVHPFIVLADANGTDPVRTNHAGRITAAMALPDGEWPIFAAGINRVARAVHDATGLRCVIHHHCAGFIERSDEIERILALTDPELVGLVFDTGHFAFGDGSCAGVVNALDRFAGRLWYVHFKDCRPDVMAQAQTNEWDYFAAVEHGIFCELGQGCVDFPAVLAWLQRRDYRGYITVEQDVLPGMGAPKESAGRNRAYLRSIGL